MIIKKFLVVILSILLIFSLIACSENKEVKDNTITKDIDNLNCKEALVKIEGNVKTPLEFKLSDYKAFETTINAQFVGCKDKKPPRDYIGVPVQKILNDAEVIKGSTKLTVIGSDGYKKSFVLEDVLSGKKVMIITDENEYLQMIVKGEDASYWVKYITTLRIK